LWTERCGTVFNWVGGANRNEQFKLRVERGIRDLGKVSRKRTKKGQWTQLDSKMCENLQVVATVYNPNSNRKKWWTQTRYDKSGNNAEWKQLAQTMRSNPSNTKWFPWTIWLLDEVLHQAEKLLWRWNGNANLVIVRKYVGIA
jgi:hypothetical protein